MRKLTYDIFTKTGDFVKNVASFKDAQDAKENGFIVKDKMVDMIERTYFDCYKNNEFVKTITLNKDRAEAKKEGFEIKSRIEWVEV